VPELAAVGPRHAMPTAVERTARRASLDAAVAAALRGSLAANTRRPHAADWRAWSAGAVTRGMAAMPASCCVTGKINYALVQRDHSEGGAGGGTRKQHRRCGDGSSVSSSPHRP
jgi:hypothetical protein